MTVLVFPVLLVSTLPFDPYPEPPSKRDAAAVPLTFETHADALISGPIPFPPGPHKLKAREADTSNSSPNAWPPGPYKLKAREAALPPGHSGDPGPGSGPRENWPSVSC